MLHCKPIPVMRTGFSLCSISNREKPVFITGIPANENWIFPVWKYYTGKTLSWPCTGPVRDCSVLGFPAMKLCQCPLTLVIYHFPSIELLSSYFGQEPKLASKSHYCLPIQEHLQHLDVSNCLNHLLQTPSHPFGEHTVSQLSADSGSFSNTVKHTRPRVILKTQQTSALVDFNQFLPGNGNYFYQPQLKPLAKRRHMWIF